jgi:hypothetical protein
MPGLDPGIHRSSQELFLKEGLPDMAERKRRRPSAGYVRQ